MPLPADSESTHASLPMPLDVRLAIDIVAPDHFDAAQPRAPRFPRIDRVRAGAVENLPDPDHAEGRL